MKTIINHLSTDPNAIYHVQLGAGASALFVLVSLWLCPNPWGIAFSALLGSFSIGVTIELVQRWQRRDGFDFFGSSQNTVTESLLDIAGTTLWPLYLFK